MTLTITFSPEAATELRADVAWYDNRHDGLGWRFEVAVDEVADGLVIWPESGAVWPGLDVGQIIRSHGVTGFPYRIIYTFNQTELLIIAVAHEKRRPGYWRDRLLSQT